MKPQSIVMILTMVGTSAAFAQEQAPPKHPVPVEEASVQVPSDEEQDEERLLIQKLEQIENDPIAREKAKAEAQVPLSAF